MRRFRGPARWRAKSRVSFDANLIQSSGRKPATAAVANLHDRSQYGSPTKKPRHGGAFSFIMIRMLSCPSSTYPFQPAGSIPRLAAFFLATFAFGSLGIVPLLAQRSNIRLARQQTFADLTDKLGANVQIEKLAEDAAGNIYMADSSGAVSVLLNATGTVSSLAQGLGHITGLVVDSVQTIYVIHAASSEVVEIARNRDAAGWQAPQRADLAGIGSPSAIAVGSAGVLYVTDAGNGTLLQVTPGAVPKVLARGLPSPTKLLLDSHGGIYVVDTKLDAIEKITTTGTTIFSSMDGVQDVFLDAAGDLYLAGRDTVTRIAADGSGRSTLPVCSGTLVAITGSETAQVLVSDGHQIIEVPPAPSPVLEFGGVTLTQSSAQNVAACTVAGHAPIALRLEIQGANASDFHLVASHTRNGASSQCAAGKTSCQVAIEFHPSSTGTRSANLQIISGATTYTIPMEGTGLI